MIARLSANLDLWCACLDHPQRAFGGLYHCAKFGSNQRSSFDNMHGFRFHQLGWKTPIHAPKIVFLGDFDPLNGETYQRNRQKAHPWQKDVIWRIDRQNRSTLATCARDEETKKRKKDKDRNPTVANWVFAETTHVVGSKWNFVWWVVFRW